jgi:hypothetical protein
MEGITKVELFFCFSFSKQNYIFFSFFVVVLAVSSYGKVKVGHHHDFEDLRGLVALHKGIGQYLSILLPSHIVVRGLLDN